MTQTLPESWALIIQLTLISPHTGDVIMSSDNRYPTQILCEAERKKVAPRLREMINKVLPKDSIYKDEQIECKQLKPESPA